MPASRAGGFLNGVIEQIATVQIANIEATECDVVAELWEKNYEEGKPDRIIYEVRLCGKPNVLFLTGRRYLVLRPEFRHG